MRCPGADEEPTARLDERSASPLELAVGGPAVRRYERAIVRLRPRDQLAVRGRIELQQAYGALAGALGVSTSAAARAVVTRALGRLVEGLSVKGDRALLASLVAAVADGWPQDWDALEARAGDDRTRCALGALRILGAVFDFHRNLAPGRPASAGRPSPASPAAPALGQWGRFILLTKLGEGSYGDVYQAYDTQLDREVALKLLKPGRSSADPTPRLLSEARMLARVRHPNVASVYGAGEHDGRPGLWMELVRGVNLEELLCSRGPMSASEAALVGLDVCRALAAVHGAGLVHRDVKTSNVMREVGGRVVLTDFGAGRHLDGQPRRQLAGTPLYLAPEVLEGRAATALSDVYSLGVVLFRLVTGSYPQGADRPGDGLGIHAGRATSLRDLRPDLPDAFVVAVERALAASPADRPPSAGALRAELGLVLGVPASWRKVRRPPAGAGGFGPLPLEPTLPGPGSQTGPRRSDPVRRPGDALRSARSQGAGVGLSAGALMAWRAR